MKRTTFSRASVGYTRVAAGAVFDGSPHAATMSEQRLTDPVMPHALQPQPRLARTFPRLMLGSWALGGVAFALAKAVYRLGARALSTVDAGLTGAQWLMFAICMMLFV